MSRILLPLGEGQPEFTAWPSQARTPGDIRKPYLEACDRWEQADREHHKVQIRVACGEATAEELAAASLKEMEALGNVEAAKNDMAEVFFACLRAILSDPQLASNLLLRLLDVLRPALAPVTDRLSNLDTRLAEVESALLRLAERVVT